MFNRWRQKWNVSWLQFALIITTFATGGSLCGYIGRKVLELAPIENPWLRVPSYIVLITLLWPFCVLLVSLPLGQFSFFKKFLGRLGRRIRVQSSTEE